MDGYLVEIRSISGLSGSPVFLHTEAKHFSPAPRGPRFYLLGLMHGHWDVKNPEADVLSRDKKDGAINTGISVVVPVTKVIEALKQDRLAEQRRLAIAERKAPNIPTPD